MRNLQDLLGGLPLCIDHFWKATPHLATLVDLRKPHVIDGELRRRCTSGFWCQPSLRHGMKELT
jgi:hypothetical protein